MKYLVLSITFVITILFFGRAYGGEKPNELPPLSSLELYSADSPFKQKLGPNPEIDPNSETLLGSVIDSEFIAISVKQFSTPVYFADENTTRHDVSLECGVTFQTGANGLKNVPIPDFAEPAFDADGFIVPMGCGQFSDMDNFMVILDLAARCEYDLWQARKTDGQWSASWGNAISMDSDGVFAKGLSARGSGFVFLNGVIWPDELRAGKIEHVLAFSYPFVKSGGPVSPATESDGTFSRDDAIPEGAILQLNPDLDLDTLDLLPYEKTIGKAMQEYGLILVDSGEEALGLYAVDPKSVDGDLYAGILPDDDFPLVNIPLNEFRVLKLPEQNSDFQETAVLEPNECADFSETKTGGDGGDEEDGDVGGKSFTFNCEHRMKQGLFFGLKTLTMNVGDTENCTLKLTNLVSGKTVKIGVGLTKWFGSAIELEPTSGETDKNGELEVTITAINEGINWSAWTVPNDKGRFEFNKKAYDTGLAWGMFVEVK